MKRFSLFAFILLTACGGGSDDEPTVPQPGTVFTFSPAIETKISQDVQRACANGAFAANREQATDVDGQQRIIVFAFCNDGLVHYLNYRLDGTLFEHFVGPFGSTITERVPL